MFEYDEEHASVITDRGLSCYKAMSFHLENIETTYQRLVNAIFKDLKRKSIEVYVDDMLVKSRVERDHMVHLGQTFFILRKYQMKLNPLKYAFGVELGKFLHLMVNQRGIEANHEKIKALLGMSSPRNPKEMMSLARKVEALSRFVSRATDYCVPFFDMLKRLKKFGQMDKCKQAFQALKEYLGWPLLLPKPIEREKFYLYLVLSNKAVGVALIREKERV